MILAGMPGRMKPALSRTAILLSLLTCGAMPLLADEGWSLMFDAVRGRLPESDQQAIYETMGFLKASKDNTLVISDATQAGPVNIAATVQDLNGDGQDEVFLLGGNLYLSGGTGSSIWLFIKSGPTGGWKMNLGFPAAAYTVLADYNEGFPDLQLAGMGWCEAVWRWNGSAYQLLKNVPTAPGGCQQPR